MKKYIIVKPGTISPQGAELIVRNGDILIEHSNPNEIVVISGASGKYQDKILEAICNGIKKAGQPLTQQYIGMEIASIYESKPKPKP